MRETISVHHCIEFQTHDLQNTSEHLKQYQVRDLIDYEGHAMVGGCK